MYSNLIFTVQVKTIEIYCTPQISAIPKCDDWMKMLSLKILYLHDNTISKLSSFGDLAGMCKDSVLSLLNKAFVKYFSSHVSVFLYLDTTFSLFHCISYNFTI